MHPALRRTLRASVLAMAVSATAPFAAHAASGLNAYDVPSTPGALKELRQQGFDTTEGVKDGRIEVVATAKQARLLEKAGLEPKRQASAQRRAIRPDGSYDVYRPYFDDTYVGEDEEGEPRQTLYEEMLALADANPSFIEAVEFGRSVNGKPLLALRMTKDARDPEVEDTRPKVMFQAAQHAREWITPEMIRRFAQQTAADYTGGDERIRRLLATRELWFAPVLNPDGYDFTFTPGNRLWRKNLREQNGIPGTQAGDGVDLNRNFPTNWGRDDEGSSPDIADETFRGTGPASEPETQAIDRLYRDERFVSVINWHSAAELLLYPFGYQVQTPSVDDAVYRALSGTDADPAIKGNGEEAPDPYDPDTSAELYTTNGDTIDHAVSRYGTFSWTPEMDVGDEDRGGGASVFEFQDSEADLQAAFEKNVPFALDVADSADDMSEPESYLGNTVPDFQPQRFAISHGNPQTVAATVKRKLGAVTVKYRINGGPEQSAPTNEVTEGERSGGVVMHDVRGEVTGTKAGDTVEVAFEAGGKRSGGFSYTVAAATGAKVLLLQAENYNGSSSFPAIANTTAPSFTDKYAAALTAAGVAFDTYDVDARGVAPDDLGVLSHYDAVVWYTGNDLLPRNPGQPGGTGVNRRSNDTQINVRNYLHEGGRLLLSGQFAAYAANIGLYGFNPQGEPPYCDAEDPATEYSGAFNRCVLVSDDFFQYDLGAYLQQTAAGSDGGDEGELKAQVAEAPLKLADEFGGSAFQLNGGDSADNQVNLSTAVTTSSILRGEQFARFASKPFAEFDGPSAYEPATGGGYVVAGDDAQGWRRLRRTVDLTGKAAGSLDFKISRDTEQAYDYVFVEAHTVGQDDWTTLPDANGHTSDDTGGSCSEVNWNEDSPFVNRYQTRVSADECLPEGTSGVWNAASGSSGGYEDWSIDLSGYAGKQVEVSITYLQDPAISGLGVFLDDARIVVDGAEVAATSFETGLDGWEAGPAPEGSVEDTQAQWRQTGDIGLEVAPGVVTADSVYLQFGLEGVRTAEQRATLMRASLTHLGVLAPPPSGGGGGGGNPPTTPGTPQPPAQPGTPPRRRSPKPTLRLGKFNANRKGVVSIRVGCPRTAAKLRCRGTVTVSRSGKRARKAYRLASGKSATVRIKVDRATRRVLRRRGKARVTVTVTNKTGSLKATQTVRRATLKR